ncbi:hypothetical protein GCM10007047_16390 [Cerasicoccus arenae]|uniref:Nucleoside phosphorylase domain-containing protein n=2 Tax=Cerasicoccus arenae TaxID=424488 RepID=A0A8J3DA43_9BACT|nr:hypothetical protein GCM10007047_16390 [Cerasicoccus arenae]
MLGVVFPSQFEGAEFLTRVKDKAPARVQRDLPTWLGKLAGHEIAVGVIGMGPPHCASRVDAFIGYYQPKMLILAGFAGALDPALKRGEVIINRGEGSIHTASDVIATAEDKARLLRETGSPLVDMESAHVAAIAEKRGIPLIVIRGVSDLADEAVPVDILCHSYDQQRGVTTPAKLGLHLATHWGDIGRLMRFLKPLSKVRRSLTSIVISEALRLNTAEAG